MELVSAGTTMKIKMLYLMHVPWDFIKQRQHFVAEYLSNYYDITVYYVKHISSDNLSINNLPSSFPINKLRLFNVPRVVNTTLSRIQLRNIVNKSKYIWITHPKMYDFIKVYLTNEHILIYDCLDDALEFPFVKQNKKKRDELYSLEREVCEKSNIIFVTSHYLRDVLSARYGRKKGVHVINNGIHLRNESIYGEKVPIHIEKLLLSKRVKIVYIGAIAEWMDFDLILESLDRFKSIEYIFIGIKEKELPVHERIVYGGPVEHQYVFNVMEMSDILVMPFIVNELILAVNPVKVYEYIYSCKPTIVCRYPETEQFRDFVMLYKTRDEYFSAIESVINKSYQSKHTENECKNFARQCTWDVRVDAMVDEIKKISGF